MVNEKQYIVLDTWLLAKASTLPKNINESNEVSKSTELLVRILHKCHRIVLDEKGEILKEYQRHAKSEFVRRWFIQLQMYADKVVYRSRTPLKISKPLHEDDIKFIEIVAKSPHKIIITGNSDLLEIKENEEIKGLGITIMDVDEALGKI